MRADDDYIALLWQHEVLRVFKDRITRASDIKWFEKNLKNILKEVSLTLTLFVDERDVPSVAYCQRHSIFFISTLPLFVHNVSFVFTNVVISSISLPFLPIVRHHCSSRFPWKLHLIHLVLSLKHGAQHRRYETILHGLESHESL